MGNEYDYKCKGFELKEVSRSEFEALKRFPDYEHLSDGTLLRIEGAKEFRIYCEDVKDVKRFPFRDHTGCMSMFEELSHELIRTLHDKPSPDDPDLIKELREQHFRNTES